MNEFWFESSGTRLFATEQGAGDVVVLLHGGMADHRAVLSYMLPLSDSFRTIAPDLRSSGKSWCGRPLTFDQLSKDLQLLLDHLGVPKAVVVGVSSGTGVAIHFSLKHPERLAGLAVVHPIYAGEERGFTPDQTALFAWMDAIASQALEKGVEVLKPLYENLPLEYRDKALEMAMEYDAVSIVATSKLLASGAQPFQSLQQLSEVKMRTLVVKGADPMHPAAVAYDYLANLPDGRQLEPNDENLMSGLHEFCRECFRAVG